MLQGFVADAGQPNCLRYGSGATFVVGNHAPGHANRLSGQTQAELVALHPGGEVLARGQACLLTSQAVEEICSQVQAAGPTQSISLIIALRLRENRRVVEGDKGVSLPFWTDGTAQIRHKGLSGGLFDGAPR